MLRTYRFRAWGKTTRSLEEPFSIYDIKDDYWDNNTNDKVFMQYTGLKDKNGDNEIYECDIIDSDGNVIGNQYETPALLEEKTNLLIQGFGTKAWLSTYKEAVERGCYDA